MSMGVILGALLVQQIWVKFKGIMGLVVNSNYLAHSILKLFKL